MANQMVYTGKSSGPHSPYVPDPGLVEAVNIALILGRPLLLEGEPGCGKSSVAFSIADELKLELHVWDIRSTSKVRDGLYTYDPPLMFDMAKAENQDVVMKYLHYGPIGQAFLSKKRAVILIDEIDKANADFSDDLLIEIDNAGFSIPEAQIEVKPAYRPIFVVTNNQSQYVLSEGFLRACIFHYVQFPTAEQLRAIAMNHLAYEESSELIDRALNFFLELRYRIAELTPNYRPSVREFLDWLRLLSLNPEKSIEQLQSRDFIPYHQVLLKHLV